MKSNPHFIIRTIKQSVGKVNKNLEKSIPRKRQTALFTLWHGRKRRFTGRAQPHRKTAALKSMFQNRRFFCLIKARTHSRPSGSGQRAICPPQARSSCETVHNHEKNAGAAPVCRAHPKAAERSQRAICPPQVRSSCETVHNHKKNAGAAPVCRAHPKAAERSQRAICPPQVRSSCETVHNREKNAGAAPVCRARPKAAGSGQRAICPPQVRGYEFIFLPEPISK